MMEENQEEDEIQNVLPVLAEYAVKDAFDASEKDDEGYDDDEYDRDINGYRSNKGRLLYCRKCEGHGVQVLLKGHTAICPYVNCLCKSCDRLMRMRKSAFLRRYRTTLKDTDTSKLKITPVRLFENTNTRFTLARNETSDSPNPDVITFPAYHAQFNLPLTSATTTEVADNLSALSIDPYSEEYFSSSSQIHPNSRRVENLQHSPFSSREMAPTHGVAGPILNSGNGIIGQHPSHPRPLLSPVVASNNLHPKMISELPNHSQPRELLNMLQAGQPGLEAYQQQQLVHFQAMQHQAMQAAAQQQQPRAMQNGTVSPPRGQVPISLATSQQLGMRAKRPNQSEVFPPNEPLNKRPTQGYLQGLPQHLPLSVMNNPQQMAMLQQLQQQQQQQQQQQAMPPPTQPPQGMPTSVPLQYRLPQRLPYSGPQPFPQPYNPPNSLLTSTSETLQNQLRALQGGAPGMAVPPRPPMQDHEQLTNIMALLAANSNGSMHLLEELKRYKEITATMPQLDSNAITQQLLAAKQEELRKSQQQQQLLQLAAQQQQQNNQRRQSLPAPIPLGTNHLNLLAAQVSAGFTSPACNTMPSPSKEGTSTSSSSAASASQMSPGQAATANGTVHYSPPVSQGPGDKRYQLFLHSIELFNRGIVNDKEALTQRYDIPESIAEAGYATHRAQIPMPSPSVPLEQVSFRTQVADTPSKPSEDHPKSNHEETPTE